MGQHRSRKNTGANIHGILLLDKPLNISSNRALQRARAIFNAKKAGHTGSLDPLASGMLPVCFGNSTKISSFLLDSGKRYTTIAQLGAVSDTGDQEGNIIKEREIPALTDNDIEAVLETFRGEIEQIPPMHSALKHKGTPLYELARKGIEVERKVRRVTIHSLDILERTDTTITLDVRCSKGTYIRTLVEDIGEMLNCGAYVGYLRRTEVDPFNHYQMYQLDELEDLRDRGELQNTLLPNDSALIQWPAITLDTDDADRFVRGQKLPWSQPLDDEMWYRIYDNNEQFLGLGCRKTGNLLSPKRIFVW